VISKPGRPLEGSVVQMPDVVLELGDDRLLPAFVRFSFSGRRCHQVIVQASIAPPEPQAVPPQGATPLKAIVLDVPNPVALHLRGQLRAERLRHIVGLESVAGPQKATPAGHPVLPPAGHEVHSHAARKGLDVGGPRRYLHLLKSVKVKVRRTRPEDGHVRDGESV